MPRIAAFVLVVAFANVLPAQSTVSTTQLVSFEKELVELSEKILPATVAIDVGSTFGSGVIVSKEGHVITAAHLYERPGRRARIILHDGTVVRGETLGRMQRDDYALIKITKKGEWPFAEMGVSSRLEKGDLCVSLGHPGGHDRRRTAPLRFGKVLSTRGRFLRTSCIIDRGDSGGPLFDLQGRVIGIHSRIGNSTTQNWHIPVDHYRHQWTRLLASENWGEADFPDGPIIGIRGDEGPGGPTIERVYPNLPAAKAGIKEGDKITKFAGKSVNDMDDLKDLISGFKVGHKVDVELERDGKTLSKTVVLMLSPSAERPEKKPATDMPVVDGKESKVISWLEASREFTKPFEKTTTRVKRSIVTIRSGEDSRRRILGTIVDANGLIITKASEVLEDPQCDLGDDRQVAARVIYKDDATDLAVLKVEAKDLTPLEFITARSTWNRGQWLLSLGDDRVLNSVVSVLPRRIRGALTGGYLGVQLGQFAGGGVKIDEVVPDSAAAKAELKANDLILKIGEKDVADRADLIEKISDHRPGDAVTLAILRGEKKLSVTVTLGSRANMNDRTQRSRRGRRRGSFNRYSRRRDGFPKAVQHDAALRSRECGGPVLDLLGRCVGINIARSHRYGTLAIPSDLVARVIKKARAEAAKSPQNAKAESSGR